jgi:hypothetical protein
MKMMFARTVFRWPGLCRGAGIILFLPCGKCWGFMKWKFYKSDLYFNHNKIRQIKAGSPCMKNIFLEAEYAP